MDIKHLRMAHMSTVIFLCTGFFMVACAGLHFSSEPQFMKFDEAKADSLRSGRPCLVIVTADW